MSAATIALVQTASDETTVPDAAVDRHWLLVTYTINGPSNGSIATHFPRTTDVEMLVWRASIKRSFQTGATWYELDNVNYTCESMGEIGTSITFVTEVSSFNADKKGETVRTLVAWLTERGDHESVAKVKEAFPDAFASPQIKPRPWWRRLL